MKKILALALALLMCMGTFASCIVVEKAPAGNEETTTAPTDEGYDLDSAKAYLKNLYKDKPTETGKDFKVITRLMIGTGVYTVEWKTDSEKVTVEKRVDEKTKEEATWVNVNEESEEELPYVLTATITAGDGSTIELSFKFTVPATKGAQLVKEPKEDTSYKFGFNQVELGKFYYVTGEVSGRYLSTTDDVNKATDVYAEAADGGFKFYILVDGAKQYITIYNNDENKLSVKYDAAGACVYKLDDATGAWVTTVDGTDYYLGTYSTYATISASKTSYINAENSGVSQFPAALIVPQAPEMISAPVADTPYNFGLKQVELGKYCYVTGDVSGRYLSTTDDLNKAIAVYVEAVDGGFKFYIKNDAGKQYITIYNNDENKLSVKYDAAGTCVYKLDATTGAWVTTVDGADYYLGTYSTYATVSASKTSYINAENSGVSQFPAGFFAYTEPEASDTPVTPNPPAADDTISAPEAGKAYKFGLNQVTLGKKLYLNGEVDGRYLKTTEDASKAVDVYAEAVEGGYKFYILVDGAKQYIVIYINADNKQAMKYDPNGTTVYKLDPTTKAWVTTLDGTAYYPGTYDTCATISASKTTFINAENTGVSQFPAGFAIVDGSTTEPETPVEPETPDTPAGTVSIADALAAADGAEVTVSGVVSVATEWSTQYNNMSVTITDGKNELYIFRLGTQVKVGDVITVVGKMDTYGGARQIAQGATATVTGTHKCDDFYADATCEDPKTCKICKTTVGEALGHSAPNAENKCDKCGHDFNAAPTTELTLSFDSTANRTALDTSHQVWEQNGVKLTNNKGSSTSNVADYSKPARFYKSTELVVECANMVKIVFVCNNTTYANALKSSITSGTVTVDGTSVTVTFDAPVSSYTIASLTGGQVRMNSLTVFAQK